MFEKEKQKAKLTIENGLAQKGDKQLLVKRTFRRWFCKRYCLPIEKKEIPNSVTIVRFLTQAKTTIMAGVSADLEAKLSRWKTL